MYTKTRLISCLLLLATRFVNSSDWKIRQSRDRKLLPPLHQILRYTQTDVHQKSMTKLIWCNLVNSEGTLRNYSDTKIDMFLEPTVAPSPPSRTTLSVVLMSMDGRFRESLSDKCCVLLNSCRFSAHKAAEFRRLHRLYEHQITMHTVWLNGSCTVATEFMKLTNAINCAGSSITRSEKRRATWTTADVSSREVKMEVPSSAPSLTTQPKTDDLRSLMPPPTFHTRKRRYQRKEEREVYPRRG
ncbi:hypothetical protein PROFUN_02101 [Planoprotostelium fungivorum]|uniref:Secreted protein n=1 Tax=Planoprotostelium fungivorum TaxID=1890364 RepID=A0A2P6NZ49_9EUKA|nr:hypothetical protein PROFUN_02101 [Planoprotostelium fungivorum]